MHIVLNFKIRPINSKFFVSWHIFTNPIQWQGKMRRGIRTWRANLKKIWSLGSSRPFMYVDHFDHSYWNIYKYTSNILQKWCFFFIFAAASKISLLFKVPIIKYKNSTRCGKFQRINGVVFFIMWIDWGIHFF